MPANRGASVRRSAVLTLALLVLGARGARAQEPPLQEFDRWVAAAVEQWGVPGLAVAVVKDGEVVFAKGYGVRELGRPGRVDTETLFANASTTKAFTTMALAMLVDEGKVDWDEPAATYVPGLVLPDPYLTANLTVRDLVTHRSGLPNADLLWYGSHNDAAEIVRRLRHLEPDASLRERYRYNNNLYAVAGQVIEAASGMTWADFISSRILEPLGMTRTLPLFAGLLEQPNVATPHDRVNGEVVPIEHLDFDNIAPAGSMNSTVADMTKWLRFMLDSARIDGERLLGAEQFAQLWQPHTPIPAESYYSAAGLAGAHFTAYGLGWFLQDYRGRLLAMHTGSIDGKVALVGLLPEERLGLVVFANRDHAELRHALMYRVFDAFTGAEPRDWSTELKQMFDEQAAEAEEERQKREAERVPGTAPSLPLERYVGEYADSAFGAIRITLENGRLAASWGRDFSGTLEHWHYDTFRATWDRPWLGRSYLTFSLAPNGEVAAVEMGYSGELLEFGRVPAPAPAAAAGR